MARDNVIKFGKAKKAMARGQKEKKAQENRVSFGRTKAEKDAARLKEQLAKNRLFGHKREDASEEE
ncbi:MAG: DUF4169 family protein [Maricaulaceae bacterium]